MDETDIMDLTHQKARKRPRPISSVDESVHASLKRLPMRAAECREPSLMFAVRGEPVHAASLKQNDHSVTSSPTTVMPAQVKRGNKVRYFCWGGRERNNSLRLGVELCTLCSRSEVTDCFGFVWMRRVNRLSFNVECARYVALFAAVIFLAIYIF